MTNQPIALSRKQRKIDRTHADKLAARVHRKAKCEECGATVQLAAHHLDGNPQNNVAENIRTLCYPCHNRWHQRLKPYSKPRLRPWQIALIKQHRANGETIRKLEHRFGVSKTTVYKALKSD